MGGRALDAAGEDGLTDLHAAERRRAACAAGLALLFYVFMGVGPDLPWGDGAIHARNVAKANVVASAHGHPLYVVAGRAFVEAVPVGPLPWRLALFSAVSAAAAVGVVHLTIERIAGSRYAAGVAAAALGVSHTFWLHASTVEVYALLALLAAVFLLGALEHLATGAPGRRRLAALVAGLACATHPLGAALLPALAHLCLTRFDGRRRRFGPPPAREAAVLAAAFAAGLAPYLAAVARAVDLGASPAAFLTDAFLEGPARGGLSFAPGDLARAAGRFAALLVWQFPSPALALAAWGVWAWARRAPRFLAATALVAVSTGALAAPLGVKDQFVFLVPAWVAAAVVVGAGAGRLAHAPFGGSGTVHLVLGATAVAVWLFPIFVYASAPTAIRSAGLEASLDATRPASAAAPTLRALPGRDDLVYYLWPPKRGAGARPFAERVLAAADSGAWVLADWAVLAPCVYLREVEGVRPDVEVVEVPFDRQAEAARGAAAAGRPVYLTTLEYGVFDIDGLKVRFEVAGEGPPWRLVPEEEILYDPRPMKMKEP